MAQIEVNLHPSSSADFTLSSFHQAIVAHELRLRHPAHDLRKLTNSLSKAKVDLNPHQIDAALFAFQSPLSRGALLADEAGLGKTIEAGLIIAQLYAEGRRKVVIIVPASLRKQWQNELSEKFGLPSYIIEGKDSSSNDPFKDRFQKREIAICSMHYVYHHIDKLRRALPLDLVVIDEAHHLRNVWKKNNKMGQEIKRLIREQPKLLLTATPLHNNLMELYGLVSFIDETLLGTQQSFQIRFMADSKGLQLQNEDELKARLRQVCIRTLRRQVQEYVRYTERHGAAERFTPFPDEHELYEKVSAYLQRDNLVALEHRQRALMLLVYRKILASSSFAIAGTLSRLIQRLENKLQGILAENLSREDLEDVEGFAEEIEELSEDREEQIKERAFTPEEIETELAELREYHRRAVGIKENAKGNALLVALHKRFEINRERGWPEKAVIFTESRRTQQYLLELLEKNGYRDCVTTFSGQNMTPATTRAREIIARAYERWKRDVPERYQEKLSQEAVIREALIHEFKHYTKILIATEAGAEGINLQFCNTVINYDLPWNPQRIEQRIGRCHRYGQKHDVVVLSFLNEKNAADQRVYELLDQKFHLFRGVFGASDEVLGAIGSGVDFEKRILDIYQRCRTPEEINAAFDKLQAELADKIQDRLTATRQKLLEHFDDEVRDKLKLIEQKTRQELSWAEQQMLALLISCLGPWWLCIDEQARRVEIRYIPRELQAYLPQNFSPGVYSYALDQPGEAGLEKLHLEHPLMEAIIKFIDDRPKDQIVPVDLLYTEGGHKITLLEPYLGQEGFWYCFKLTFSGLEQEEHLIHIVFVHQPERGWQRIAPEIAQKFPQITARQGSHIPPQSPPLEIQEQLPQALDEYIRSLQTEIENRNLQYVDKEYEKLDTYMEEALLALLKDRERIEQQMQELRRQIERTQDYKERLELRQKQDGLEKAYYRKVTQIEKERRRLFREKEKRIRDLQRKSQLQIGQKIVGICHWRLL